MDFLSSLHNLMDAGSLLQSFGPYILLGVAVVIFIESGVLFPHSCQVIHCSLPRPSCATS